MSAVFLRLCGFRRLGNSGGRFLVESKCKRSNILYDQSMSTFSDRLRNTVVNKWGRYWQDLMKDYLDVFKESYEHSKDYPKKTAVYFSLLGFSWFCFHSNPDYNDYRESVIKHSNNILLVAKPVRNPKSDKFLSSIETCHSLNLLHRLNLGFFSVIWVDNYGNDLGLYQASCSYLKPRYLTFSSRVVDIGFFGRWWRLNNIMEDFDINPNEWNVEKTSGSEEHRQ